MKTLSGTLEAAQKSASSLPYVEAVFGDYQGDRTRLRFTRHYSGAEDVAPVAAFGPSDGSLVRARVDPNDGKVYTSRIATPGPASTFNSWTLLATGWTQGRVALAGYGANVFLFMVHTDHQGIRQWSSSDYGATWSGPTTVATASADVGALAAAVSAAGDRLLVWGEGTADIYRAKYAGSWGARTAWTNTVSAWSGLAVQHFLDFQVVVTASEPTTNKRHVYTCLYGDGGNQALNTWGPLVSVISADDAGLFAGILYINPALVNLGAWRLFFVEWFFGDVSDQRLQYSTMDSTLDLSADRWREPAPLDYESFYGVAAAVTADGAVWLTATGGVWSASSPASDDLDVSAYVLEAVVDVEERGGKAVLVLDDEGARFAGYGGDELGSLRRGARLQLTPGFRSSAGAETPAPFGYFVDSIERVTGPYPRLVVVARDGWWLLERWRARRQYVWAEGEKSVGQLLQLVLGRAGLDTSSVSASAALADLLPAFTIQVGETGASAVSRLLAMVPDELYFDGGNGRLVFFEAGDAPVYTLGPDDHLVVEAAYRDVGPLTNWVRVVGDGVIGQAFDFDELDGYELPALSSDRRLTVGADAAERAEAQLRDAAVRGRRDVVRLFGVGCGLEMFDLVELNDDAAGLVAAPRRVLGLSWRFKRRAGLYDMSLELGSP